MEGRNSELIIFDLDNTLVDKNAVFERAQKKMIELVKGKKGAKEDMKILREMDSILIKEHKRHLYSFEILALSLWFYFHKHLNKRESVQKGLDIFKNSSNQLEKIEKIISLARKAAAAHNALLENTPAELFDGVIEVLEELRKKGFRMVLLSEGSESLQRKTLEVNGLEQYFDDIVLCSQKNKKCFLDIKNRWEQSNEGKEVTIIVVGDGIERDIEPGNEIGATTVWKPGNFNPGSPSFGMKQPDYSIRNIREILAIIG
jgi:FMN phosphatase YigB (HAD superfamily)